MWWALPAATALLGANRANKEADQRKQYNIAQSELTRYSPWTGMKGELDNSYSKSALEGGLAGGIQGLGITQSLGKTPWDFADATQAPATNGLSLGADEQIADIGQKYGQPQGLKPNIFGNGGGYNLGMNSFKKFSPY